MASSGERVSSVTRALRILRLIAHAEKPVPLHEIAEALGIPKSTAHGILRDLVAERFLDLHEPAAYTVGITAFEVGAGHLRVAGVDGVITSELAELSRATDATAHYAVLEGPAAVYLYKQDPPALGVQLASAVGARLPAQLTAVGTSCLAWLGEDAVAAHLAGVEPEIDLDALAADLAVVRERGYAVDPGRVATGVECVAAPVFDASGPRGAVGVSYLRGSHTASEGPTAVADRVRATAARLTTVFGGTTG